MTQIQDMPIQRLPDHVINQIAAGEVVERPSHLLKELVENSLDAGANEIEVDFAEGGRRVRVRDNGTGMSAAQARLSVARHATSKIRTTDDLWQLSSYGFRGEALASIASVSQFTLQTKADTESGLELRLQFGEPQIEKAYAGSVGTTVLVEDLFANVPARLKFLKSEGAENSSLKNMMKALALANPGVSFRVLQDGRLWNYWPATDDILDRVKAVLERPQFFFGQNRLGPYSTQVVVAPPQDVAFQNKHIWVFVNGRFVQDRNIQFAVTEAYRSFLMHGEYPIAAVFVMSPATDIDVNVHPTKSQVKFKDGQLVFRLVQKAVRDVLEAGPWVSALTTPAPPLMPPQLAFVSPQSSTVTAPQVTPSSAVAPAPMVTNLVATTSGWRHLPLLGQIHQTYIVLENKDGLLLLDQHAAHERVLFERLFHQWQDSTIEVQNLLVPLILDVGVGAVESLKPYLDGLAKLGLDLSEIGPGSLAVRSLPALLREDSLMHALQKILNQIEQVGPGFILESAVADVLATMACHSAVRAGQTLEREEIDGLLAQLDEYKTSTFCPHGRPVFLQLSLPEIERRFGRA
jgi:DNA mismatch repair protein MutL